MYGIETIVKLNNIKETNKAALASLYQPKSVFGQSGKPPEVKPVEPVKQ